MSALRVTAYPDVSGWRPDQSATGVRQVVLHRSVNVPRVLELKYDRHRSPVLNRGSELNALRRGDAGAIKVRINLSDYQNMFDGSVSAEHSPQRGRSSEPSTSEIRRRFTQDTNSRSHVARRDNSLFRM